MWGFLGLLALMGVALAIEELVVWAYTRARRG
jgi:hypothetical protein